MTTIKRKTRITLLLGLAASMAALPAVAQEWSIEPVLSIGGEIDDNASLSIRTDEEAEITGWIADVLDDIQDEDTIQRVKGQVLELCGRFPVYA